MPRYFASLGQFSAFMQTLSARSTSVTEKGVGEAGLLIWREAKGIFGNPALLAPPLASSTVRAREKGWGYYRNEPTGGASPSSTLLWTGSLRESIEFFQDGMTVGIGTADERMLWQELGTARIPPRPVLRQAAIRASDAGWEIVMYAARTAAGLTPLSFVS